MILCSVCDTLFNQDIQVEAQFIPDIICEDCLQAEEQLQQTWNQLDQDEQAINDFCKEPS